jgi:hypothetical protein
MNTKYMPYILAHTFMFHLRRNNLTDALASIDRVIACKLKNENSVQVHEGYIEFYLKKVQLLIKMKRLGEADQLIKKA